MAASRGGSKATTTGACRFFGTAEGCTRGAACPFKHESRTSTSSPSRASTSSPSRASTSSPSRDGAPMAFYLVLDFEATCSEDRSFGPQEVIEFPVVCVDAAARAIVWEVHHYVKPEVHPRLTEFCTQLTGITQATVDRGVSFPVALRALEEKLESVGLWPCTAATPPWTFVTCGDWDLKTMLPVQLRVSKLPRPSYFGDWINIKLAFQHHFKSPRPPRGMTDMLGQLKIKLVGRHHSGIDDSRNIASVLLALLNQGARLQPTFVYRERS